MKPETAREVEIARAAYIQGRQDERAVWRENIKRPRPDTELAATLYPMPAEVTP